MPKTLLNGRYRPVRGLGSGGFGQTFVAEDMHPSAADRKCVVKQFKPVAQDAAFLEIARRLFINEVEVLRRLGSHDRIPALLDDFVEDEQFYLVQEYVEGRALSDELTILHRLTEPQAIALLRDVLEVLEFVHHNNVIHRDIKPSNLIRREQDGRIVVIDFGAVKEIQTQLAREPGSPTMLTIGIATQGYGPSEQLAGKPRLNSDIYALGMTAIQAVTGLHPSQLPNHPVTGEVIWRDRADVSLWLAAILDKMTRYHFNQRFQSVTDVLNALESTALVQPTDMQPAHDFGWNGETQLPPTQLSNLETTLTGAVGMDAPDARSPRQSLLWKSLIIGAAGLLTTGLVSGIRQVGGLQPLELALYDRMIQSIPDPGADPRLLVVGITEADIQTEKHFPLSDQTIATTIRQLQRYTPRAIGLDLFRDIPQESGRADLLRELTAPNVITITNLGDPITPPPPGVSADHVGFNDVVLDSDSVVRRNLMLTDVQGTTYFSFALRLATIYLAKDGIILQASVGDPSIPQLGKTRFPPLEKDSGGYQDLDNQGYQIVLKYRGRTIAEQVSLGSVLNGQLKPEQVRDRIVLIGTTAANAKDLFLTPYSPTEKASPRMAGVLIHAHMLSQFLTAADNGHATVGFWAEWLNILWVGGVAVLSSLVAWQILRYPVFTIVTEAGLVVGAIAIGFFCFTQQTWIPIAAPVLAILVAGGTIVVYRLSQATKPHPRSSR